jgi:hypothetical protein
MIGKFFYIYIIFFGGGVGWLVRSVPLKTQLPHNECRGYSKINLLRYFRFKNRCMEVVDLVILFESILYQHSNL